MEQLNIVGKRSGEGFVTHKAAMVNVLSRGIAPRLTLMDFTIGRKGLLNCVKSLSGSNVVKFVPSANGNGSDENDVEAIKRLKVVCGSFYTYLDDQQWVDEKTPHHYAEVRISPTNTVWPNIGSTELAEAITRVLPFTATKDDKPTLQCVKCEAGDGRLHLVAADGFTLGIATLDFDGEGSVLIHRDDLKDMASALRKAKRVRLTFERDGEDGHESTALLIDTEIARYKFPTVIGNFPDFGKVMPPGFATTIQMDAVEVMKAVNTLKTTADNPRDYAVDLTIGNGALTMATPDQDGTVTVSADVGDADATIRLDGKYLVSAMRAMGGMTDFSLNRPYEPCQFTADGLMVLVMPMVSHKAQEAQREDYKAEQPEAEQPEAEQPEAEPEAEQPEVEQPEAEPEAEQPRAEQRGRRRQTANV